MTKQELNRDIKRLWVRYENKDSELDVYEALEEMRQELKRLYYADDDFEYMNLRSIKIMIRLNLSLRVVPLHQFGLGIEL